MKVLIKVLLIIWQLPQEIIGGIMYLIMPKTAVQKVQGAIVSYCPWMRGGVTIGSFIFVDETYYKEKYLLYKKRIVKHEWGHTIQSKLLGLLYLFIIGIPSLIHAGVHTGGDYYHFYTEKWANRLSEKYFKEW